MRNRGLIKYLFADIVTLHRRSYYKFVNMIFMTFFFYYETKVI